MKKTTETHSKQRIELKLPYGTTQIGPGTVPTSEASRESTSMEKVTAGMRQISRENLYPIKVE